jgi:hypothetical protein
MFLLAGFSEFAHQHRIDSWPRTDGKVSSFSTSLPEGRSRIQEYSVEVDYAVNAHPFHLRKQAALTSQDRSSITNLHTGSLVPVGYNPTNPAEAKIFIGNLAPRHLFLFFMAALCALSTLIALKLQPRKTNV